ncbi:MAG TPA: HAMP domain-containing sensor histidine kinase [Armatimonadota bacterium]
MKPTNGDLAELIADAVDSQTKLDLVCFFVRHPFTTESLRSLCEELGHDPAAVDTAARELTAAGFLHADGPRSFGPDTVYRLSPNDPRWRLWQALDTACAGEERAEVLQRVQIADQENLIRRLTAERRLHDLQTRFLAMVSDQLRNPLSAIMGLLVSLLAHEERLAGDQVHTLQRVQQHTQALIRLVEDLLLSSRLSSGGPALLSLGRCDLRSLVDEVEQESAREHPEYEWSLEAEPVPLVIEADREQLRQVLGVLVRNALKFCPPGCHITLATGVTGPDAWVSVDDTGPGLGPADEERIFSMFYQAETDCTRLSGGLGLGLYLARTIVEAHGGYIAVEPKSSPGLRVTFHIPRQGPPGCPDKAAETHARENPDC